MSAIGLYRIKTADNLEAGDYIVNFYKDGVFSGSKIIHVKDVCINETILVRYLDRSGMYKEYPFNKFWEGKDATTKIGSTNNLITSLLESKSNTQNIGYNTQKTISLVATEVSSTELLQLSDLFSSPRVYISFDLSNDTSWLEVEAKSKTGIYRTRKGVFTKVELEINLPETFNIKMI